ncbi:MAG: hypothetical protein QXY45_02770 [Candidatus Aenigmatarchaeota archaeon]
MVPILSILFILIISGCVNRNKGVVECKSDYDCFDDNNICPDGTDPYDFCDNGVCGKRVFVRDPCIDHTCPKGTWIRKDENSCFTYRNCAKTGCDDNSEGTIDECIGIGTRSEGCLYKLRDVK